MGIDNKKNPQQWSITQQQKSQPQSPSPFNSTK